MADKMHQSKSDQDLKSAPLPPLPFAGQITKKEDEVKMEKDVQRLTYKEGNLTVDEAKILLKDWEKKQNELKKKIDELFYIRGESPERIEAFVNNPSNISREDWENFNNKRRELLESFNLQPEQIEMAEKIMPDQSGVALPQSQISSSAPKTDKPKERRKMGGAQRRGWIPMR